MGRSASHVALECALETQPNICLIGEEVAAKKMSLADITSYIADSVEKRGNNGENFGVAIIPEGIVEFVPEFSKLIAEINELLAGNRTEEFNALPDWKAKYAFIKSGLSDESFAVFEILPRFVQQQLFLERDPHGNVQVSLIESEKLFSEMVKTELDKLELYLQRHGYRCFRTRGALVEEERIDVYDETGPEWMAVAQKNGLLNYIDPCDSIKDLKAARIIKMLEEDA